MDSQQWWDYIKTDDPFLKCRYFLRNYGGMGLSLRETLDFLATKVNLTCHRLYGEIAGSYSIQDETRSIVFRVDPTTPTVNGSKQFPSVVVCN